MIKSFLIFVSIVLFLLFSFASYNIYIHIKTVDCKDNQIIYHRVGGNSICVDDPGFDGIGGSNE